MEHLGRKSSNDSPFLIVVAQEVDGCVVVAIMLNWLAWYFLFNSWTKDKKKVSEHFSFKIVVESAEYTTAASPVKVLAESMPKLVVHANQQKLPLL
jgi:hypothetical protein